WMHGQYNSIYRDNNLTLQQSIPFPSALINQLKLGKEQVAGAEQNLIVQQNNLVYDVKSIYYLMLYQEAFGDLLMTQDSLYKDFANASSLRYKTGESNLLEKTTAVTQLSEIENQRQQNRADIQISGARLQALLKSDLLITASDKLLKRQLSSESEAGQIRNNPSLKLANQEVSISQQFKRVERSRIMPDLLVGAFGQSLTGYQKTSNISDVFYPRSKVFTGFQLGLAIPLWIKPNLARAKAASFQEDAMRKNAQNLETVLRATYEQAIRELDKNSNSLHYYETNALQNGELILNQARKAFHSGEIGYLEYLQALKTSLGIKGNYLQALNQYNQSVLKLEFLLGKF
ncbi:MAG TPA: TolC family protein, partial [Cyclobacteriaceae bacterium]|nr:TolC family protein [Cyclobacteriaceae bacterium]